nr:hypothetical protein [Pseudomonas prosekii]
MVLDRRGRHRRRDLALFDLAIGSKLRACDLMKPKLRVRDVAPGEYVSSRAMVMQQKTQRPPGLLTPFSIFSSQFHRTDRKHWRVASGGVFGIEPQTK